MKAIKEKIVEYRSTLDNKDSISISQILELKKLIANAEKNLQSDELGEIKGDIVYLKSLIENNFNIKDLEYKLHRFLEITEKAIFQHKPMKNFAHRIHYLENFINLFYLSLENLGKWEKLVLEMDIDLLDIYVHYLKMEYRKLLETEEKNPLKLQDPALNKFLEILKNTAKQDNSEMSEPLNSSLKKICQYLYQNPQLFSSLKNDEATYLSKEHTHLNFTVQIKNTEEGFQLYVSLKCKIEDWTRRGAYKIVKKNLMLIHGKWVKGVDAVVYGEKESKNPRGDINLTMAECERAKNLNPLYVHKLVSAAGYTHKGRYKQSFVSELADSTLEDIITSPAPGALSICELFILCYSTASSIAYLHSDAVNLAHNDIKSDNFLIFYDEDGVAWAKVSDLG